MRQTFAILLDAYRELNARKLFWITLVLSGLVVLAVGAVTLTPDGMKILVWEIEIEFLNSNVIPVDTFYKLVFVELGIQFWLGWIATILGLISTASIFPDFVSGGSIELVLSKPIGRLRLFLTKYVTGLLFLALQVTVFTLAAFLVIGIRGNDWEPGLFLAIPIMAIFFSYLFCVSALIGLLTRSAIAALLLTILLWFVIFLVHTSETTLLAFRLGQENSIEQREQRIEQVEQRIGELSARGKADLSSPQSLRPDEAPPAQPDEPGILGMVQWAWEESTRRAMDSEPNRLREMERLETELDELEAKLESDRDTLENLTFFHNLLFGIKTALPKTAETTELMNRYLVEAAEMEELANRQTDQASPGQDRDRAEPAADSNGMMTQEAQLEAGRRVEERIRSRSEFWVIGTSLGFEAVILAIGALIFCRRDF